MPDCRHIATVSVFHTILLIKAYMIHHTHCVHMIISIFFNFVFVLLLSSIFSFHVYTMDMHWFELFFHSICYKQRKQNWLQSLKKAGFPTHTHAFWYINSIDFENIFFLSTLNYHWYNDLWNTGNLIFWFRNLFSSFSLGS